MKTLQFKCTLLTDIIINQKAATKGPNKTLDFIPGSNFLGIAASILYNKYAEEPSKTLELFHSGKVRFGDAHPANGNNRSLKIPADMFYPKLSKPTDGCYVMHLTDGKDPAIRKLQLKQCRAGFYDFTDEKSKEAMKVETSVNFAIKSAHDRDRRTSMDEQMYGYESLEKGLTMFFEVEVDDDSFADDIRNALVGKNKRVGRSRSAQYGLVSIEECSFNSATGRGAEGDIVVYAESRLIFLDEETGNPTFRVTPVQLGLNPDAKIDWGKSQIRTFQYAPRNYVRDCFDTDRCGIEKGSVIIVRNGKCNSASAYVGEYKNEGFGKVIYNPAFLEAVKSDKNTDNGKARYALKDKKAGKDKKQENDEQKSEDMVPSTKLLKFLVDREKEERLNAYILYRVNDWVKNGNIRAKFKGQTFASQWGAIRSMASQHTEKLIRDCLFGGVTVPEKDAYLTHGVAKEKWEHNGRNRELRKFIDNLSDLDEAHIRLALVNLASEMAKLARKEESK